MERDFGAPPEDDQETILDVVGRWLHACGVWVSATARKIGRWVRKRARIAWVEREITVLREGRGEALGKLGQSVYAAFRDEIAARPELVAQIDQIQQIEADLARKRRLLDRIEREEVV